MEEAAVDVWSIPEHIFKPVLVDHHPCCARLQFDFSEIRKM